MLFLSLFPTARAKVFLKDSLKFLLYVSLLGLFKEEKILSQLSHSVFCSQCLFSYNIWFIILHQAKCAIISTAVTVEYEQEEFEFSNGGSAAVRILSIVKMIHSCVFLAVFTLRNSCKYLAINLGYLNSCSSVLFLLLQFWIGSVQALHTMWNWLCNVRAKFCFLSCDSKLSRKGLLPPKANF